MAVISAGTTTTTALVQTGDTTGNLVIKTGSSGTTALTVSGADQSVTFAGAVNITTAVLTNPTINGNVTTTGLNFDSNTLVIDATNNRVGIGTSSPLQKLGVEGAGDTRIDVRSTDANPVSLQLRTSHTAPNNNNWSITAGSGGTRNLVFTDNLAAERMRIDSSGNVGIGTTNTAPANGTGLVVGSSGTIARIDMRNSTTGLASGDGTSFYLSGNDFTIENRETGFVAFATSLTERMRIDTSGNLLVGSSTNLNSARLFVKNIAGDANNPVMNIQCQATTVATSMIGFYDGASDFQGQIFSSPASNTTTYATSSDYRLKKDIAPMTGALSKVQLLKPVTYKWKKSDIDADGFIAHELAEVCPQAVIGEKDAVDEDGKIIPQMIDTSFLVATLTAAIQELNAKVTALEAQLENK